MALKATIYKADIELSDLDRNVYWDHSVTVARHPSETDERLLVRLLSFALNAPADQNENPLELAKDMWEPDEPSLWQKDLTDEVTHWIKSGQPDEKRLLRTAARVDRMTVQSFNSSTPEMVERSRKPPHPPAQSHGLADPIEAEPGIGGYGSTGDEVAGHGPGRINLGRRRRSVGRNHPSSTDGAVGQLSSRPVAGFVLANGSMSSNQSGEGTDGKAHNYSTN